jgi:hypothetical protein
MSHSKRLFLGLVVCAGLVGAGCSPKGSTFSLLPDQNNFQQNAASTNGKIDILWVIDNSGSMATSQANLAANFQRFISTFDTKGFDYRLAVTTTDAYLELFGAGAAQSVFRDGTDNTSHTGVFVVTPQTPNLSQTFLTNVQQGTFGSGDERAFQSFKQALSNPANLPFPRPDAFLSVIMLSDEDDFSHATPISFDNQYSNPALYTVDSYVAFLDSLTGATSVTRSMKYNVNSISILDEACRTTLSNAFPGRKIGTRYIDLSQKTNGVQESLCGDFGTAMSDISSKIIELVTQFFLTRVPNANSLSVTVGGVAVPELTSSSPQPWNGFIYHADTNSITFHGNAVPGPGAAIAVSFDPTSIK